MSKLSRNLLRTPPADGQVLPFAKSVTANGFVFVSGQVGIQDGQIVAGGIEAETEQAIANIAKILSQAGCTLADVVKVTAWLTTRDDFAAFNTVFAKHFGGHLPARATVVAELMVDAKVELDAIACLP